MTFEESADECYLTVCECCGFSAETSLLFPYMTRIRLLRGNSIIIVATIISAIPPTLQILNIVSYVRGARKG
ncbi:hypothetical protein RR48_08871 [Papilio machaon]|uniref:Uncharacterized protein n=1 Tax=Papilio machaon TaxID=76193 RepID=A0A194QWT3_PAPMA|nr:hypothetical protein RR48_08871 [Papilio machaon]